MTAEANTCQQGGSEKRQGCVFWVKAWARSGISLTSYSPRVLVIKTEKVQNLCAKRKQRFTTWVTLPNTWKRKGATYVTCQTSSAKSDHSIC